MYLKQGIVISGRVIASRCVAPAVNVKVQEADGLASALSTVVEIRESSSIQQESYSNKTHK